MDQLENWVDLNKILLKESLDGSWNFFKQYTEIPGVYQFTIGSESYVGSTKNIYNRCFIQHKNQAFTNTKKHKLFYTRVVKHGWKDFSFNLLCTLPNHVEVFFEKFPDTILTEKEILFLEMLTTYETTWMEQLYLDYLKPKLNGSLLANWSTYNKGSTGYVRTKKMNDRLSLSFLNRTFSNKTKELQKIRNTGKVLSKNIKLKISKGSGGIPVKLIDINNNSQVIEFKNKSLLAKELNISLRTVSRRIKDGKFNSTKSMKFSKVKLML